MKETPREIPTKKYPDNNVPLKDPTSNKNYDDPKHDSGREKKCNSLKRRNGNGPL